VEGTRPGADPIADIVEHRVAVFTPAVDLLIAEIVALGGRDELQDRYGLFYWGPPSFKHELDSVHPLPDDFDAELRTIRDRREREAREARWETDRLLAEARDGRPRS
jgi:hypothetical protein